VNPVAAGVHLIDLHHGWHPAVIAAAVVELEAGIALVDPGPGSTLDALEVGLNEAGLALDDIRTILLTHVHLDHAGATGAILARHPHIEVLVHERGAPHLVDPSRLLRSAQRLFGDRMDQLWGPCLPVPSDRVRPLEGGEARLLGGRFATRYTPGHASHHIAYLHEPTGVALVGDAAGCRIRGAPEVIPACPPPDIDLDLLRQSLHAIAAWKPTRLLLSHFGTADGVAEHVAAFERSLEDWAGQVRRSLADPGDDAARAAAFALHVGSRLRHSLAPELVGAYERGAPPHMSWFGLARYWRTRGTDSTR